MAEIDKIMENPNADAVLDQNEDGENSELTSSTDENGKNVDSATSEDKDSLENDEVWAMESPAIQQRIKELTSAMRGLVSQMNPQHSDYQTDLKILEQTHLSEIEKLSQQFKIKLTAKNKFCLELLTNIKEDMLAKDDIIQKLSTDIENQKIEIEKLKERSKITTAKNIQLRTYILKKDEINRKLSTDIENQKQTHLIEIANLKQLETDLQELKAQIKQNRVSCSICQAPCTRIGYHRLVSLECGHLFGYQCISECLEARQYCPQCRATAYEDEILFLKLKKNL